ncbi:uncharacterized protein C16orf96 homolog isoform X2 [Hyla sarda]|uniref:uncharacterized protein C16orf96 homolog isoform X2 n=1 Tax=Hyla sarda TaxID=327740 RepID=UPI0024C38078|nr:uncharacterized protein C16orf96 homolog isoform X2 [Hyla sarda]
MSGSVSFKELLNLAIGSPELGAVNFNALYSLLYGLLEQLQVGDLQRTLSQEEREFIQPGQINVDDSGKPSTLFHRLQDKVTQMEAKLQHLDALPSSTGLLQASQSQKKPVEEMWQLMQLKKKTELNEDGVNKAMGAFQELLSTFNTLRQANDLIQERVAALGNQLKNINIQEVERRLQDLDGITQHIPLLKDKMENMQKRLSSYPEQSQLATWPSLHDTLTDKSADWALSNDTKQRNVKKILSSLGALPVKHDGLERRVHDIEQELKRLDLEMGNMAIPEDLLQQLRDLRKDVENLFSENRKDKVDLNALKSGLHDLNLALQRLDTKTDKLAADLAESATFQSQIDELEKKKLNQEDFMLELNLKADKRVLETKVGHAQLEAAIAEVNAILEDLMKKSAAQDSEWQNMLAKLLAGLEAKLSRSDLDSIHKDLEELWRFLKKHLNSVQTFDPDGAAGSRKKLFERVKCISCDRPVTMANGPHLVTVRSLMPRNNTSSGEYSKNLGDPAHISDSEYQYNEAPRPHTSCSFHRKAARNPNLTTVFPYGDPGQVQYKNSEFDLMGVDGVMYKGRMDKSHTAYISERDTQVKTPQPPYRITMERARSATPHYRSSSTPTSRPPSHSAQSSRTAQQALSATDLLQPTFHVPSTTETTNFMHQSINGEEQVV